MIKSDILCEIRSIGPARTWNHHSVNCQPTESQRKIQIVILVMHPRKKKKKKKDMLI
jgi:hypothetical protein